MYKYFYINCLNRHIAEDLTSQTFVAFIEKTKVMTIDDNKKYLYAIMRNTWTDYLRAKYRQAVDSLESIEDFEDHASKIIDVFETSDFKQRAMNFIERLPKKQQEIAKLRLIEERGIREVAEILGKNSSYVKTTQNRAIKSLKRMLNEPELGGALS